MRVEFSKRAAEEYRYWQKKNPRLWERINRLLRDIAERPFGGIGKPEPLRHDLTGFWSRRITGEHRLVYRVEKGVIQVAQCRFHYEK